MRCMKERFRRSATRSNGSELFLKMEWRDPVRRTNKDGLIYCHPLAIAIQEGLKERFCTTFEKEELIIASCLHPKFKLSWLAGDKRKLTQTYLEDLLGIPSAENSLMSDKHDDNDDLFNFKQQTSNEKSAFDVWQRFLKSTVVGVVSGITQKFFIQQERLRNTANDTENYRYRKYGVQPQ
ncbi:uncharacterized protein LOC112589353 [Harpegnathos saltator]|uniref:uncharacterized protein LOC112589353 n=1 Tax=Harpegnathos saltator TaxID=610380 RepID=UPI000DBEEB51|nr:uncharacterized protein LOC112589353 [Harpegnathos saltator]